MNNYIKELNDAIKERDKEFLKNVGITGIVLLAGFAISGISILASKKLKYLLV